MRRRRWCPHGASEYALSRLDFWAHKANNKKLINKWNSHGYRSNLRLFFFFFSKPSFSHSEVWPLIDDESILDHHRSSGPCPCHAQRTLVSRRRNHSDTYMSRLRVQHSTIPQIDIYVDMSVWILQGLRSSTWHVTRLPSRARGFDLAGQVGANKCTLLESVPYPFPSRTHHRWAQLVERAVPPHRHTWRKFGHFLSWSTCRVKFFRHAMICTLLSTKMTPNSLSVLTSMRCDYLSSLNEWTMQITRTFVPITRSINEI